jgi:hypothetical protein
MTDMGEPLLETTLFDAVWLWLPLWSAGLVVLVAIWVGWKTSATQWVIPILGVAAVAAIPVFPVMDARQPPLTPTQVVYRFDDHRWLELTGWLCEGALIYVDAEQHIRTVASPQFYRIVSYPYIHPSTRYIAIPFRDLSAIMISRDGGRTFGPDARVWVGFHNRYGAEDPSVDDVKQFVVVDDRGYIEAKNGRVLQSSLPIGDYWGLAYIDYPLTEKDKRMTYYDEPGFQDLKSKVPEVKNYTGWTHMQCDPNAGIVPPKTSLAGIPGLIYSAEAYTIGVPVYFGWRAYRRMHKPGLSSEG